MTGVPEVDRLIVGCTVVAAVLAVAAAAAWLLTSPQDGPR